MKTLKYILPLFASMLITACYGDYTHDFEEPNMGFAVEKPLRTVIADRNMPIYIGVSIGGKREVDMNDWATFAIDESLLAGTGKELLPSSYYSLSSNDHFTVRKSNLPVADVKIDFNDSFFNDPLSLEEHYALPFRMTGNSLNAIRENAEYTIAVIKYVSTYSGTYYRYGTLKSAGSTTSFGNETDLVKSGTTAAVTVNRNTVRCAGLGNLNYGNLVLEISGTSVKVSIEGDAKLVSGNGTYKAEGSHDFVGEHGVKAPQIELDYSFTYGGETYNVSEVLVLRQDPEKDLRVVSW